MTIKEVKEILEIGYLGLELFNNQENFYKWLESSCLALGQRVPEDLLETQKGRELVKNTLLALLYGNYI